MQLLIIYLYEPSQNFKWKCIHSLRESSYNTLWESRYALVWYAEIPTYQHDSISRSKQIGALWGSILIFVAGNENITNLLSHCWCSIRSCIKTKTSHYPFIIIRVQNVHSHYYHAALAAYLQHSEDDVDCHPIRHGPFRSLSKSTFALLWMRFISEDISCTRYATLIIAAAKITQNVDSGLIQSFKNEKASTM